MNGLVKTIKEILSANPMTNKINLYFVVPGEIYNKNCLQKFNKTSTELLNRLYFCQPKRVINRSIVILLQVSKTITH